MKHFQDHASIEIVLLLSNNPQAFALERAKKFNIPSKIFTRLEFRESEEVLIWLHKRNVTHLVLAGFMWLVPDYLVRSYPHRIINIHPALLPKFGGKGMYGVYVHEAVKASGEKETGITIHEVNERYDEGKILFQATCEVNTTDTPEQIANKIHQLEHAHYPKVIEAWIMNKG